MLFNNECHCKCHKENQQIKHIMACCGRCDVCHKQIRLMFLDSHRLVCQEKRDEQLNKIRQIIANARPPEKETCEHNWVMDGHNAGDPICSKCYKRE